MLNLKEAKERCEKATPGPWVRFSDRSWNAVLPCMRGGRVFEHCTKSDADFAVCARADLPEALRLIEEAKELLIKDPVRNYSPETWNSMRLKWLKEVE